MLLGRVEADLILLTRPYCSHVVVFFFFITPFPDLFYKNYALFTPAKLVTSLLRILTSSCPLILKCLLDFSPLPCLTPSGTSM